VVVVCDSNTYMAAGQRVCEIVRAANRDLLDPFLFEDHNLYADYSLAERLQTFLGNTDAIPVAVGSGTINDLTKLAAHLCGRPYMVVGTAASMDGYTAFGASITRDGYKQTISCPAPLAVVVDLDIIAHAPPGMNVAGYADLLAKIPAGADWILADAAGAEAIDTAAWELVQDNLRQWVGNPAAVRRGDRAALAKLVEGLIMTGLGIQRASSSRPASGAEHQFSHLWDMQRHTHRGTAPMHGQQVAIGTLTSAAMHERVFMMEADDLATDEATIRARWPRWENIEQAIENDFSAATLAKQVIKQSRDKYLDPSALAKRLQQLHQNWPSTRSRLRAQLLPTARLQEMLAAAGAPHRPEEIGISRNRLHASTRQAQRIRSRYTVLDIITEAGWWRPCVDNLFAPGGYWHEG
jgi:glycerol-1-phosphate dehydrogenase [NAD(P)+]